MPVVTPRSVRLRVRGLGKAYRRYARKSGRLAEWLGLGVRHELHWVLRDVTFDLGSGEAVGIVGANGAGKSTLLKLIAGTVRPTAGSFELDGRASALLELGIGFHPELTGRQNAFMAAHVLGIGAQRITQLMDEVEEFAEIDGYMDEPVRTYSSGMQVRLAFSVATAVRPEVLIVDEALSVGDTYFQHKSFERIRRFRDQGTTLLIVSHNATTIKSLCDRALLLEHGSLLRDGAPDAVLDYYNALIAAHQNEYEIRQTEESGRSVTRSGSAEVVIESTELVGPGGSIRTIRSGDPAVIRMTVRARVALADVTVGFLIRDRLGNDVFGTNTFHLHAESRSLAAGEATSIEFRFDALNLGVGTYSVSAALHSGATHLAASYDWWDRSLVFEVIPGTGPISVGVCSIPVTAAWRAVAKEPSSV